MASSNWIKVVERRGQSVLISSYFYNGIQETYFKKMFGLSHGLDHGLVLDYSYYYDADDFAACKKELNELLAATDFAFLKNAFGTIHEQGEQLIRTAKTLSSFRSELTRSQGVQLFRYLSEAFLSFGPALYFPVLVEEIVENQVREIMKKYSIPDSFFVVLTSPQQPTDGSHELLELHRIALTLQKTGAVPSEVIQHHLANYGWLSYTKFVGEPWTETSVRKRIGMLAAQKNLSEEIQHLEAIYTDNKEETKKLFERHAVSSSDRRIILLAKELAWIRTYRIDAYTKAGFYAKPLFASLAQHLGITPEEFVFLTYEEIITLLESGEKAPRDTIQRRRTALWQLKFDHGKMVLTYENFEHTEMPSAQNEVRGTVACTSNKTVRGAAKIIRGVLEFGKMKTGDILITSMTTPDFVPLMEKAAAIVTDEGGITSHAAIVSRELKKPCVIGTKFATKVFKDGDVVDVDAVKGTVRKAE